MSVPEIFSFMPIIIAGCAAVLVLVAGPLIQARALNWTAIIASVTAGVWSVVASAPVPSSLPGVAFTPLANFLVPLFCFAAAITLLLSHGYNERRAMKGEEFPATLLFGLFALCVLPCCTNLLTLFLALEAISFTFYILVSYDLNRPESSEAGLKYLLMGAVSTAITAFGLALIFAASGTLTLSAALAASGERAITAAGWGVLLIGIAFKLSLVPAHLWTPDVYQGAPAPVAGFLSTASKVAAAGFLLMLLAFRPPLPEIHVPLYALSLLSMVLGNLAALLQKNIKRMLAYSSIAHMGYLMLALLTGTRDGYAAVLLYGAIYTTMNLAAFGAIASLSGDKERMEIADYDGAGYSTPFRGAMLATAMIALAGIPPTSGFIGKFFIFYSAIRAGEITLAIIGIVSAAISAYFYLKVVVHLYMHKVEADSAAPAVAHPTTPAESLALCCVALSIVAIGIYPAPLLRLVETVLP
jgi:NADH-quinone oxidoreductase subunit N